MWAKKIKTEWYQNWWLLYRSEMNEITSGKLISHLTKYWIRLTGWLIVRPKIALAVKIRNYESHKRKERQKTLPKERKSNWETVGSLLEAGRIYSSDHNLVWGWSYGFLWNFYGKRYSDPGSEQLRFDRPRESELNCRAVATLLKAVGWFRQLSPGLKLGNR